MLNVPLKRLPNPDSIEVTLPIKDLNTPNNFPPLSMSCSPRRMIVGRLFTNQPTIIVPTKSSILPRNPLVLDAITLPCLLIAPPIPEASIISSLSLLRTASLLLWKLVLSIDIERCFSLLVCASD